MAAASAADGGAPDAPAGLATTPRIFAADKGDACDLAPALPACEDNGTAPRRDDA
jgi:hypothetical protein